MKKTLLLCMMVSLFVACRDKKKPLPEPDPGPPVEFKSQVKVKINGQDFNCDFCGSTYYSGGSYGVNFKEGDGRFIFSFEEFPGTGSHEIVPQGKVTFLYEKDGLYYRGRGLLNLTTIDTSSTGSIRKLKGTFDCKTDTVQGVSYEFSQGVLDI
jgi:hypothetical protein